MLGNLQRPLHQQFQFTQENVRETCSKRSHFLLMKLAHFNEVLRQLILMALETGDDLPAEKMTHSILVADIVWRRSIKHNNEATNNRLSALPF